MCGIVAIYACGETGGTVVNRSGSAARTRLPNAWYALPPPADEATPHPCRLNGDDLLMWRGRRGWVVSARTCPHAGADLAGGAIRQRELVCPFHGHVFSDSGCPADLADDALAVRPTVSQDALVWVWGGTGPAPPSWGPPEVRSPVDGWTVCGQYDETVTASLVEVFENVVDVGHFGPVHGSESSPELRSLEVDGHRLRVTTSHQLGSGHRLLVHIDAEGPGATVASFGQPLWLKLVTYHVPLDERRTAVRCTGLARAAPDRPTRLAGASSMFRILHEQLRQDEAIWSRRDPSIDHRASGALDAIRGWLSSFS